MLPPHQGRWWKEKCRQIIITPLVTRANAGTHEFLFTLGTGLLDRGAVRSEKKGVYILLWRVGSVHDEAEQVKVSFPHSRTVTVNGGGHCL